MRVACQIGLPPTGGGGAHGPVASVARCVHARVAVVVNCALDGWQVKSTASIQALRKPCVHYTMQHATRALYNATCNVPRALRQTMRRATRRAQHVASIHATRKPPCVAQCTSHRGMLCCRVPTRCSATGSRSSTGSSRRRTTSSSRAAMLRRQTAVVCIPCAPAPALARICAAMFPPERSRRALRSAAQHGTAL